MFKIEIDPSILVDVLANMKDSELNWLKASVDIEFYKRRHPVIPLYDGPPFRFQDHPLTEEEKKMVNTPLPDKPYGSRIEAIKMYRARLLGVGCGLKQAKDAIEAYCSGY